MLHMADYVHARMILSLLVFPIFQASWSQGQAVPAIFVFGDSFVDVGNNNYLPLSLAKANFPHNGIDFPAHIATGRFSNGKNIADFIAEKVGLPSSPPYLSLGSASGVSYLTGVNFASGGAGILNPKNPLDTQSVPLCKQVQQYLEVQQGLTQHLGSSGAQKHLSKSLFFISFGSNDILAYSGSSDLRMTPLQEYVAQMATTLKAQLKTIYVHGARKFVVVGLPPIGCCPSQRIKNTTRGCREDSNTWSLFFNDALTSLLQELKSELGNMTYSYGHSYPIVKSFIENPSAHGFREVKAACCGLGDLNAQIACLPVSQHCSNRGDHLFWDLFHPTEAAAGLYVDYIYDGPSQYASPINVRQLTAI
ncbi:hypothetical protein SAY87_021288 [Trapa incisa]|uniref:GDSL esterase/lipase n=1 Tax=Trapa incisa TaxID=236973 RepID=A0AAN7JQV9_9MYRT|nr:hypothetical protein SAY87_021288 [Trapa incisa]